MFLFVSRHKPTIRQLTVKDQIYVFRKGGKDGGRWGRVLGVNTRMLTRLGSSSGSLLSKIL